MKINKCLLTFETENIFSQVTKKVKEYKSKHPDKKIISLGIGDVSQPIVKPVIEAMHQAVNDLSDMKTFKGYGAYFGYDFLKEKILENDYKNFNFAKDELYISNGTKTDSTSILELFDLDAKILITDPMYPIYRDGSKALCRNVNILPISEKDDFIPQIPNEKFDIIYICSPSNPTGIALDKITLGKWVNYAIENDSVIIYDNVYESFISSKNVPKSIYEIKDADRVCIELRSFSKNASFTGVRCSYYIVPNNLYPNINDIWKKRTMNRFNGADYIAQKGAEAVYLEESQKLIKENIDYYKNNLKTLSQTFIDCGFKFFGGNDSPYLWVKCKDNLTSWEMMELFLEKLDIIIIPGIIFGNGGDRYFRVSALGKYEDVLIACQRIKNYYIKGKL